ncbi:unnamed protein product [Phaedon cochleariae]|uniref:TELO2-interacting protein 1 homolog n=1 Tax=Phaedon cochleariae TaxID=80249 RepID=A0A9N9X5K2_PHACE|nr:unnamed protein product [Phaedon cochleariae]
MNLPGNFQTFSQVKGLCMSLIQNPKDIISIRKLNGILVESENSFVKVIQPIVLSTFYPIIKKISEDKSSFSDDEKQCITDTLGNLLDKSIIDKLGLFFNIYAFLLFEIYDHMQHKVLPIHEEYKLSIMQCTKSLAKSVSSDLLFDLYTKGNAPKLCQMLYVSIEIAKNEQLRSLRIAAIECIMSLARVLSDDDYQDLILRKQVSEVFLFFLPGVASGLKQIALEDEKVGHKIPVIALRAWGRIVTLLMQDYNVSDQSLNTEFESFKFIEMTISNSQKMKWKDNKEITEHLNSTKISPQWYKDTDKKLEGLVQEFGKVLHHSHPKVRKELSHMCENILYHCLRTMPLSSRHLIEIIITLSEDEEIEIANKSKIILMNLSQKLSSNNMKTLLESLEEGFLKGINSLPRKFNGIDEREQLASLNLIIGYLNIFGEHNLTQVLLSGNHLNKLMQTLLHISELKKSSVGLLEEYSIKDLHPDLDLGAPWKKFVYFKEDSVQLKLEKLCSLLAKYNSFQMVSDFLLDTIMYNQEHRKEAIFILNGAILGIQFNEVNEQIIKSIVNTYIDNKYWQIPLKVGLDEFGREITLAEVQQNVIQMCLLVEGLGKIALIFKEHFQQFIFKVLYSILERAGSSHSLIRAAGLAALGNITLSCGYSSITTLINENIDYFTYSVERRLNRSDDKEKVLSVLSVVLMYSTMDVLQYLAYIIEDVLVQSCDKFKEKNSTAFLRVFKIFIKCLRKWLEIEIEEKPIIPKAQKDREIEDFKVTGSKESCDDFSDEIMGQTAEEMFQEDMIKKQEELDNQIEESEGEEYKKPDPPLHVKLTVAILTRSLHFLPSKDKLKKLLVLEILTNGLEVIRDYEDELLPIVHQVWSPLVQRFKEFDEPLVINFSFQLLMTLARLSKEFILMRTTKEVLPNILIVLNRLSKESYLKDKGSAYRYSQNYKLQLQLLENLAQILIHLDVNEPNLNKVMESIHAYLSDKQPLPLQMAAKEFFKRFASYDPIPVLKKLEFWESNNRNNEFENNLNQLLLFIK